MVPSIICATLIDFPKKIIRSKYSNNRPRQSPTDFVPQRKLPFSVSDILDITRMKNSENP